MLLISPSVCLSNVRRSKRRFLGLCLLSTTKAVFTADELKWSSRTAVREVEFLNCSSVEFVCCEHGLIGNSVLEVEPTGQRPAEVAKTDGDIVSPSLERHFISKLLRAL